MITPAQIIDLAASDMNDSAQRVYNWTSMRPYLNVALLELLERYEESNIPITSKQMSGVINVPIGETEIGYTGVSQLPPDLLEIEVMWESNDGGNSWSMTTRRDTIDPNIATGSNLIYFGVYVWRGDHVQVPACTSIMQVKFEYIRKIINVPLLASQENQPLPLDREILFLAHKTAALCAALIGQNETRAGELTELAEQAINRELNIPIKSQQSIPYRRRPFRSRYKTQGIRF